MGKEARMGVGNGPGWKATGVECEAQHTTPPRGSHRQNVVEIELEFDGEKELSKIKDEPTMLLKANNLINDKMSDAMMLLNRMDFDVIDGNLIKMCSMDRI